MTAPVWPGLGFDPAPGDAAATGGLGRRLGDVAGQLGGTHAVLTAVAGQQGRWTGEASAAFAAKLDVLPDYLHRAQTSLQRAAGVLGGWQSTLGRLQSRARDLESAAVAARAELLQAQEVERAAWTHPDLQLVGRPVPAVELAGVQRRVDAAQAQLERASAAVARWRASLQDLLARGAALLVEHRDLARRAAEDIRRAHDGVAPPEPAWFEQAGQFVADHLDEIGDVAGVLAGVTSALALIPGLTLIAGPIALLSGGVALLAHGADMIVRDRWGDAGAWIDVGADVAGLVPGFRVLKAAGEGVAASVQLGHGIAPAAAAGWQAGRQAAPGAIAEMGHVGSVARYVGDGLTPLIDSALHVSPDAGVVQKGVEALFDVGPQLPTTVQLVTGQDDPLVAGASSGVDVGINGSSDVFDWVDRLRAGAAAAS